MALGDPPDVRPRPEPRIDVVVGQRGEPAIARRGERRQDVDATEQTVQRPVEQVAERAKIAPERIRIGQQLGAGLHGAHRVALPADQAPIAA